MSFRFPALLAGLLLSCGVAPGTPAATAVPIDRLSLPTLFADHMVLQRDRPLSVWGRARPNERVTVQLAAASETTAADAAGRWGLTLPAQPASTSPLTLRATAASGTVELKDVLLGDVWLCGGQSNMSISAGHFTTPEAKRDVATADFPLVRQFGVVEHFADRPQDDVKGEWLVCSPRTAGRFSAVAFHFAQRLHAETRVPIGIVRSAKGSTAIEMWVSQETLLTSPAFEPVAAKMRPSLAAWDRERAEAVRAGKGPEAADFPPFPFGEKARRPRCVTLYNGMIAPLAPATFRGVVWYQGEGNAADEASALQYQGRLGTLIRSWRLLLGDERLPFYFVQLPAYKQPTDSPAGGDDWSVLRESQRKCLTIPNTAMAVTIDVGEADDIHPRNKFDVGNRLALLALRNGYGRKDLIASGPMFREVVMEGNRARLTFDGVGGGLMPGKKNGRGPAAEDRGATLRHFAVAGADRKWFWADAVIEGETVVVSSAQVPSPVAVRYAFASNPVGANLYNRDGLPASPFRTDDWPIHR